MYTQNTEYKNEQSTSLTYTELNGATKIGIATTICYIMIDRKYMFTCESWITDKNDTDYINNSI